MLGESPVKSSCSRTSRFPLWQASTALETASVEARGEDEEVLLAWGRELLPSKASTPFDSLIMLKLNQMIENRISHQDIKMVWTIIGIIKYKIWSIVTFTEKE